MNPFEQWLLECECEPRIGVDRFIEDGFRGFGLEAENVASAKDLLSDMVANGDFIILGFTSNIISSGLREHLMFLCRETCIGAVISSAGGIEEDFIKCVSGNTLVGNFSPDDAALRRSGLNRIGNLLVPNDNYVKFEDFLTPILDQQACEGHVAPSELIDRIAQSLPSEESVYYWCAHRRIPVFCPAITDGSLGDMIFFHSLQRKNKGGGICLDVQKDVRSFMKVIQSVPADRNISAVFIGGGIPKHHTLRACRMAGRKIDRVVALTSGHAHERTSSSAWNVSDEIENGSLSANGTHVIVRCDASLVFPLLVNSLLKKVT